MRFRNTLILAVLSSRARGLPLLRRVKPPPEESKKEKLLDFDPDDVTRSTLDVPRSRDRARARRDGDWQHHHAGRRRGRRGRRSKNLLDAIAEREVKKTLDDAAEDLAPFGLDKPDGDGHGDAQGPASCRRIKVGKTSPVGYLDLRPARRRRRRSSSPARRSTSGMDKQPKDLRDKKILDFTDDDGARGSRCSGAAGTASPREEGRRLEDRAAGSITRPTTTPCAPCSRPCAPCAPSTSPTTSRADADLAAYGLDNRRARARAAQPATTRRPRCWSARRRREQRHLREGRRPADGLRRRRWVYRDLDKSANDFRDKTLLAFDPTTVDRGRRHAHATVSRSR